MPSMIDRTINGLSKEIAIAALDGNTIAVGSPARVRATVQADTHVSADVLSLLAGKESAAMSFALRTHWGRAS